MADWGRLGGRGTVEDRRGMPRGVLGGGLGTLVLLMGVTYLMGGNPLEVLLQADPAVFTDVQTTEDAAEFEGDDTYEVFVSTVLGSNNEYWKHVLQTKNNSYTEPTVVLFRGQTNSACGGAISAIGPHYCPTDSTIYLDETFFEELSQQFGAKGGDVAEAYVIAHEVGHHVQHVLGSLGATQTNAESIQTELQADCLAGLWAGSLKDKAVFAPGEIMEAMDAAAAVGDDSIQKKTQGEVQPESWTHGSSKERVAAFTKGFESGDVDQCL